MREFKISGTIYSKQRARVSTNKKTGYTHSYTPPTTVKYEGVIKSAYMEKFLSKETVTKTVKGKNKEVEEYVINDKFPILTEAFAVEIICYYGLGKSFSKKRLEEIKTGKEKATKTPDVDNITKSILDALNGICYEDDKLCVKVYVEKLWSDTEEEYVVVRIYENPDELKVFTDVEHPDIYTNTMVYSDRESKYVYIPVHLVWDKDKNIYIDINEVS